MSSLKGFGILDPTGLNNNPLTGIPYSENYRKLAEKWKMLPAYENAESIINDIIDNQVILIESSTGSGKTVLVPKYALHALQYNGSVVTTLPKQTITKAAAEFSAATLDVKLGEQVGYQYKGSNKKSSSTKLLYATDGTIVMKLFKNIMLPDYDIVIIDEAHERKVQIDLLIYLLRETLNVRPDFKLIIMSATINSEIFENYFYKFKFKKLNIGGRTNYPIESVFLKEPLDYMPSLNYGYDLLTEIIENNFKNNKNNKNSDTIFFVTSSNETFDMCKRLDIFRKNDNNHVFCVELYAGMDSTKQQLAQDKDLYKTYNNSNYKIKIIISTNVAESSLTVDGIKYVIDSGRELKSSYDPKFRAKRLDRKMITQAQAKQRMGRTGRTEPGTCYHLYTKDEFDYQMEKYPEPDIRTSDISTECLKLLNFDTIQTIPVLLNILTQFIEPPKENYIRDAITIIKQYGLIDDDDKINDLGKIVASIGDITVGLMMVYAIYYKCIKEAIIIISMIDVCKKNLSEVFVLPSSIIKNKNDIKQLKNLEEKFNKKKKKFMDKSGDHISLLKIYDAWNNNYQKILEKTKDNKKINELNNQWLHKNFIKGSVVSKAKKQIKKLNNNLFNLRKEIDEKNLIVENIDEIIGLDINDRVTLAIIKSHKLNYAVKSTNNVYRTSLMDRVNMDKNSFLFDKPPKEIIYTELFISMDRPTLNIVSKYKKKLIKYIR